MAPRREEDEGVVVIGEETELSQSPSRVSSFSGDHFIKSLSSMSLEHMEDTPTPPEANNEVETAKASLANSLNLISQRGDRLLGRVSDILDSHNSTILVKACKSSLQVEFQLMLQKAQLLLDHMDEGGQECPITSWRVSLSQIRADAYLELIETALNCPDASFFDMALLKTVTSIAAQLDTKSADMRISPWNLSSLAFDVTVGTPVEHVLGGELPLNLQVKAIQEIQANDMAVNDKVMSSRACKLEIERCVHEVGSFRAGAGSVGDVLVTVRITPIGGEQMSDDSLVEQKHEKNWETDKMESCRPVIKEARNVQVNAFPPSPKSFVDLYVSTIHGDCDTTITLRFPTYKTWDNAVPDVRVELVLG